MYPMYRFMDSHPYQRNQVPYNPHYYPHIEPNPHHMNIDPTRSSLAYESWPCGGNYGYPYPPPCHNCCIHNNSPNHCSFRPPYPYILPPPYSNPVYPGLYPAHYVPPPHFTMEQPRYEYDKNMDSDHHCCGCSNHLCYKKGGSTVKIEEQDQDKKNEGNESLVPFGFKNSPFPVVWLPPDYMKNGEHMKPTGSKGKEQEDDSQVLKPYSDLRSFEQPKAWNVWPPYQLNNLESPTQSGDSTRKQHHDDVSKKQFPFPIIWMPYKPEDAEGKISKETDSGNSVKQEPTSPSKSTIPRLHDAKVSRENEVNSGSETREKGLKKDYITKTIPVKQVEQTEKNLDEKGEKASERQHGDATEKKVQDGDKKQSSSPKRSPKLPPVCLRVDPLPRKRSSNGSSRSPSPPGGKGKVVESHSDISKPPNLSNEMANLQRDKSLATGVPEKNIEVQPRQSKTKVVEVAQGTSKEDKLQDQRTGFPDLKGQARDQTGEADTNKAANEPKCRLDGAAATIHSNEGHQSGEGGEAAERKADAVDDMKKDTRRKISDEGAAIIIQSAYRGFNTRRWEPLNKLKQIAKIKEQMAELKSRIQALEKLADNGVDNKERNIITESIMGLLLKLDTIQGLHPTVRESRKSVAKELASLQEKLDLMNCKKQPAESEQSSTAKSGDTKCRTVEESIPFQGGEEMQKLEQDNDVTEVDERLKFDDAKEPCEEKPICVTQTLSNSQHVGNAEIPAAKEENKKNEVMENFSSGCAVETGDEASELPSESKESSDDKLVDENSVVVKIKEEHDKSEESLLNSIPYAGELMSNSGAEVRGCGLKERGEDVDELLELPLGVLDEETSTQGLTEVKKEEVLQYDKGDLIAHIPEVKDTDTERLEHHHLEGLGETPVALGPENMNNSNIKAENSEVLETHSGVSVDVPEKEEEEIREARPLNEGAEISDVDDTVDMRKNGTEAEQYSTASDVLSIHPHEETITTKQPADTTDTEKSETVEVLQEKMHNAVDRDIEILDSGKAAELSAEPLLSMVTSDEVNEYHVPYKHTFQEENLMAQGEGLPDHNVEVEQKLTEDIFELKEEQTLAAENRAPVTEEPIDRNITLASPTCAAATTETELLGEKVLDVAEDHSFSSTPNEVTDTKEQKEWTKVNESPSSPTASQVSFGSDAFSESDRKLIEENEKLREMMEKLIEAGKEQLTAISSLSGRVKDLEKRLSRKKKLKLKRNRVPPAGSACMKPSNDSLNDRAVGLAM